MAKPLTKKQEAANECREAIAKLQEIVKPGMTIYTILRHASRSGMQRRISLAVADGDSIRDISFIAARALGDRINRNDGGVIVNGCGMDMGFHLVYNLASVLFPSGFACLGDRCPASDHFNGVKTDWHKQGGYALRHSWL